MTSPPSASRLDEIREFALMTRDHPNEYQYSEYVHELLEAFEGALKVIAVLCETRGQSR